MKPEIEAVFIDINKAELRQRIADAGGKLLQPEMRMQRVIFALDGHSFARVRDEGNKITMTYKRVDRCTITGTQEINLTVDNYDDAVAFLQALGHQIKAEQETLREEWELDGVELDIDTWPWLPTYVEVEGGSVEAVQAVAEKLGFNMADAHYGSVDEIYKLYYDVTSEDVNTAPIIKFIDPPAWLAGKEIREFDLPEVARS